MDPNSSMGPIAGNVGESTVSSLPAPPSDSLLATSNSASPPDGIQDPMPPADSAAATDNVALALKPDSTPGTPASKGTPTKAERKSRAKEKDADGKDVKEGIKEGGGASSKKENKKKEKEEPVSAEQITANLKESRLKAAAQALFEKNQKKAK